MRDDYRRELAAEVRGAVPRAPGVYAFLDAGGRLLYVGKSVNLRRRVGNYFGRNPLAAEPHLGRLVSSIRGFAWWQTRSELLALLLEDVLIKELLPPMNTRRREFEENRYLELTDDPFPTCLIVDHVGDFGARDAYGPLRDKYFAATMRDIVHEALGVRTCSEPEPARRCLEYDIGRCTGPCRGTIEPGEYRGLVALAREFLCGNAGPVVGRLAATRDRAAASKRYEEAARLRDAIETCRRFEERQRFADRFLEEDCRVRCDEDGLEYRFTKGALVSPHDVVVASGHGGPGANPASDGFDVDAIGRHAVAVLRRPTSSDRRLVADRTGIVLSWARRQGDGCQVWLGGRRQ